MIEVTSSLLTDPAWLAGRILLARRLYGDAPDRVLGTVWWYSTSSVLAGASLEPLVAAGRAGSPALDAITLWISGDGRLLDAASSHAFDGDPVALGTAMREAISPAVECLSQVCGAGGRALWAIAVDSIASRLLWAARATGDVAVAVDLADRIGDGLGTPIPRPRFTQVGPHTVVHRVSCCLIDRATGQEKCTSCPNQAPELRRQRIRDALG